MENQHQKKRRDQIAMALATAYMSDMRWPMSTEAAITIVASAETLLSVLDRQAKINGEDVIRLGWGENNE